MLILVSVSMISVTYKRVPPFVNSARGYVRDMVTPIRQGFTTVFNPVYNVVSGAFNYSNLKSQNLKLQEEIASLKGGAISNSYAQTELAKISKELHITYLKGIGTTTAQVISYTPSNVQVSIEVDKGKSSGVQVGNPVVTDLGLVGRVVQVSNFSSTVLLLTDPNFAAGVRFANAAGVGLAVGEGSGDSLNVQLVDPGTSLSKGEVVYTSGLSGEVYPAGIPVGRIMSAYTPPGGLQEQVTLSPLAPVGNLQFVDVLKWLPPTP
ncbi:MAG: rod shape-determining protein MreC [Actinomycetota bacterium]|nr:rod shape-determining protein MreC [Actinomycetota bacterium]